MTRRLALTAAGLALIATTTACMPKPPPSAPKPQCGPYSVVHEGRPLPCVPGPGDRIDYLMAGPVTPATPASVRNAAVARCNAMGGAAYWSDTVMVNQRTLVCRTAT
jgi:hypothetical protein